jgi:twinkle protein
MKTAKELSQLLATQAETVARHLLPNGKLIGQEWCTGDIGDNRGKSLKVRISGFKAGLWADFSQGTGKGTSGDLIDLWASERSISISQAMKEAAEYLGLYDQQFSGYKKESYCKPKIQSVPTVIPNSSVMEYLITKRCLSRETIKAFNIGETADEIIFPYIRDGEIIFIKYLKLHRPDGKKECRVDANCEPCLFGWHLVPSNARKVIICEGEIDAMTFYQLGFPALSVPFGGGSGNKQKWIEHEFARLSVFDEIYLCFDDDKEGDTAQKELLIRLGSHRCKIVQLPMKDVNECLQNGMDAEYIKYYLDNAKILDPEELKRAYEFLKGVIDKFHGNNGIEIGYSSCIEKAKDKILFRPNELSIWTGINGHGKSQFLGQIILNMMQNNAKVCVASLEINPVKFLYKLTRQASAMRLPSIEYITYIHEWYQDKLWMFNLVGNAKSDRLLEVFLYAHKRYNVDVFLIDSFMKLDFELDDYNKQKLFVEKLCDFKNQYNCHIHLVMHPRKGLNESIKPGKLDIMGTGAFTNLADNCFNLWRNKDKEQCINKLAIGKQLTDKELLKLDEVDCIWTCDKQREGEWEGSIGLWFDIESFRYLDSKYSKPQRIVNYSCNSNSNSNSKEK